MSARPAIPPPPCCAICGGDHGIVAHSDVNAAAHEWARAVLEQAREESAALAEGVSLVQRAVLWQARERRALMWAAQTALLMARGA